MYFLKENVLDYFLKLNPTAVLSAWKIANIF